MEVRDRGAGMTEEQLRDMVRRISPPDVSGRGLGIDLARRLAVLSGGTLEWFMREGGGTVARLDLPVAGGDSR
jgi:K+-sensing histidine kinase KdpD